MLNLSDKTPFATGGHRDCFVHPNATDKCIKVIHSHRRQVIEKKVAYFQIFRKKEHYDENYREMLGYRYVASLRDEQVWRHLPRYYGFIETDLGRGGVTQLMRDYDGNISISLEQGIKNLKKAGRKLGEDHHRSLDELRLFLEDTRILPRNLNPGNILLVRLSRYQERLYIIDDIGFREWFPLAKWSHRLVRYKIRKKMALLEERLRGILESP